MYIEEQFLEKYIWDIDKNQKNIEKHGISFQRTSIALEHGNPVKGLPRTDGREDHYVHLNKESFKVVTTQEGGKTKIISAHKREKFDENYVSLAKEQGVQKNENINQDFKQWKNLDLDQKREASADVKKLSQKHDSEKEALIKINDLTPDQISREQEKLEKQQILEARKERKPRLAEHSKEREKLAKAQGVKLKYAYARSAFKARQHQDENKLKQTKTVDSRKADELEEIKKHRQKRKEQNKKRKKTKFM